MNGFLLPKGNVQRSEMAPKSGQRIIEKRELQNKIKPKEAPFSMLEFSVSNIIPNCMGIMVVSKNEQKEKCFIQ